MAGTKTSHNDTPNTPDVHESKIARMKVGDLRRELKSRGVKGTADLKKPELVKKMIKVATSEASSGSKKSTAKKSVAASSSGSKSSASKSSGSKSSASTSSGSKSSGAKSGSKSSGSKSVALKSSASKPSASTSTAKKGSSGARKSTSGASAVVKKGSSAAKKNPTPGNDTPNTPDVHESKIARMKVDDLRRELKNRGVKGTAGLKKPELVRKLVDASIAQSTSSAQSSSVSKTKGSGGKRTGKATSDSLKYAQEIKSTADKPERAGRSLVTTDHEVIRQWAKARKAVPSTVAGTEHDGHLGVLRLDFPGYSGDRLTEVSWDDWFDAFDKRRLNFIYQQKQTSGKRSNFFRLENPDE